MEPAFCAFALRSLFQSVLFVKGRHRLLRNAISPPYAQQVFNSGAESGERKEKEEREERETEIHIRRFSRLTLFFRSDSTRLSFSESLLHAYAALCGIKEKEDRIVSTCLSLQEIDRLCVCEPQCVRVRSLHKLAEGAGTCETHQ